MPDLYVIAGPNGAGKSTFSPLLVPLYMNVFDVDMLLKERQQSYPDIDSWRLMEAIEEHDFEDSKQNAIRERLGFAFETNFAGEDPLYTPNQFRQAGYRTNLLYIGLDSFQAAVARVAKRVAAGGHNVTNEEINSRYHRSLENLARHLGFFDRAILFNNQKGLKIAMPRPFLELERGVVIAKNLPIPKWAKHLPVEDLSQHKSADTHHSKGRKR